MLHKLITKLKNKMQSGLPNERGQSLIIFTFAILGLIAMLGLALDLGLVYIERNRINRTTDAATLASVVELPFEQDAINRAIEFIQRNGYNVGQDTEILVRGCVDLSRPYGSTGSGTVSPQNVSEMLPYGTEIVTTTTTITGATYITSTVQPPVATFMIDTGSYQTANGNSVDTEECNPGTDLFGTASKIRVQGQVNVRMNFMQFFGWNFIPVQEVAVAQNVTNLDVVIVFDVSGSMESETTCYDCWVRTSYDPDFPNTNGYANPLPPVPNVKLCTDPVTPYNDGSNNYLVHEAELYSREVGDWDFDARVPGQGFWVLQRASRSNSNNKHKVLEIDGTTLYGEPNWQRNQMGNPGNQSSNVCNPNALVGGDPNICSAEDCSGSEDCSAFIKAHPYNVYGQQASAGPKLQGGAYNVNCFSGSTLSGTCWSNKSSNPDYPAPSNVPYVEYDFTPTWSGSTSIWIRAIGGGEHAREWNGVAPTSLQNYRDSVFWQVDNSTILENNSVPNNANGQSDDWRNNRADNSRWGWVRLGAVGTTANTQHTLKIYQGSAGYAIDKIIFTDNSSTSVPAAMQLNSGRGPSATLGSATREACNLCNPAFGQTSVNTTQCTCKLSASDTANSGYGAGQGCTSVLVDGTNQLGDDLYAGIQPIRGAQEAVKRFIKRLDPKFDQVGFVAFTTNTVNGSKSRSKLQCLRWAGQHLSGVDKCYDPASSPISYTNVLNAVERQWAVGGTDIAEGVREGLEELGVTGYSNGNSCTTTSNDGNSCDRSGSARRVMILLTDGSPNNDPGSCNPSDTGVDLWDGLVGPNDDAYECAMYYASEAAFNNVTLYAIGLGGGTNLDLLNAMATGVDPRGGILNDGNDVTYFNGRGGQAFNAATPSELDSIFDTILSNIYVRIVG